MVQVSRPKNFLFVLLFRLVTDLIGVRNRLAFESVALNDFI